MEEFRGFLRMFEQDLFHLYQEGKVSSQDLEGIEIPAMDQGSSNLQCGRSGVQSSPQPRELSPVEIEDGILQDSESISPSREDHFLEGNILD